jgi:hypothetical protein
MMRGIQALEREMGVPGGFFARLAEQSDWSFIVQLHALIECQGTPKSGQ